MYKQILLAAAFASAIIPLPALAQQPAEVTAPATLPVGTCINMGNSLELEDEGMHGTKRIDAADFERIAATGFQTIRLPVRWDTHSSSEAPYTIEPAWLDRVTEVVDMALASGLNVILDSHHFNPIHEDPAGVAPWHGGVWRQVAARFAGYPEDTLWFELENEPHNKFTNDNLLETLAPALAAVRETNPTRPVIYGGGNWSGVDSLATLPLPEDPNAYPTFHYYEPFAFTHQGASWVEPEAPPVGRSYGEAGDAAQLAGDVAKVRAYAERTGKLPFMGETGAYEEHVPLAQRVAYAKAVHEAFAPLGVGICTWAYTNTFPFYDAQKGEWLAGMRGALGLADDTTAPPMSTAGPAPAFDTSREPKARRLPSELAAFDDQLPGWLVNDPSSLEWTSYGPALKRSVNAQAEVPNGGVALTFEVTRAGDPWSAGANIPLIADIEEGRRYTIGFWARAVSSEAPDGKGMVQVRFQRDREPYPGFGDTTVSVGPDWQFHEVSAVADADIPRKDALAVMQFGSAVQTLEIGQAIVVADAASITQ
ncbi:hypothetical protein E3U23_08615 [Erythrobacter litoralis]|uniref:cellulase family glycosylhydrolase n=1 Tax=Erythrobacter litoralis TaxID=39960 RepID=UPI002435F835|nr:cellulase family glycosylhydrolase [Erythrobacter litoralis]MDG6079254.1 hypothetical protein [Erythrobacter litoralis]